MTHSDALLYSLNAALLLSLSILGYWVGHKRAYSLKWLALAALMAGVAAHFVVVATYLALGTARFDGKCKPIFGSAYDCRLVDHLGIVGTIVAIGMLPWLILFSSTFLLSAVLARRGLR